jgi:hypothetical protein
MDLEATKTILGIKIPVNYCKNHLQSSNTCYYGTVDIITQDFSFVGVETRF